VKIINEEDRNATHHLESKRTIYHEQYQVSDFANVNHAVEVIVALDERQSSFLPADDGDRALGFVQRLFCVPSNETFEEGGFADPRRPDNGDDDGWGVVVGCSVDEGDMEACLVPLDIATSLTVCSAT
jgi:hypothetical protein